MHPAAGQASPGQRRRQDTETEEDKMTDEPDELLTMDEVITRLRVSRATFYRPRRMGAGPRWLRLPGGQVRVRSGALEACLRLTQN
jgi:predicted DNA-binding transcriptional regulator AlpA